MKPQEPAAGASGSAASGEDIKREYEFWHGAHPHGRQRYVRRGDKVTPFVEHHEKWGHEGTVRLGPPIGGRGPMVQVVWDDMDVSWHWPSELRRLGRA